MIRPFKKYQHLTPGLALWHLRFNYLKEVWELFYPGGSAAERSTLQWAVDHWNRDKTARPTDFPFLEDLTIHSYRARIIGISKPWIPDQVTRLNIHNPIELGDWLSHLPSARWFQGMNWLEERMSNQRLSSSWSGHWNNHVRFCKVMEPYMTLCYAIKHGDTGLLRHAMREVCIILQAPSANKPKYALAMLR